MLSIPGVDALGRIACVEIFIKLKPRYLLNDGDTIFFGSSWVDGGLVYHNVSNSNDFANGGASFDEGSEIGVIILVYGSRNCYDIEVTIPNILYLICIL